MSQPSSPRTHGLENFLLHLIDASTHLSIEALEHTQQVLDQLEKLGHRLATMKHHVDRFSDESRHTLKQQAMDTCKDVTEIGLECVKGSGQILKAAFDELHELGQSGEGLFKHILEPSLAFANPFRQKQSGRKKSKEPTIIPISIQDN